MNALLGTVNALLAVLDERPARAVVACFGAEQAAYRVGLYRALSRPPRADAGGAAPRSGRRPRRCWRAWAGRCATRASWRPTTRCSPTRAPRSEAGGQALLLTADRDLFQAVDEHTSVVELAKGRVAGEIGPEQVRERYHGVGPELVTDLIALRGDPSDGLPGAPGVGVKRAAELLLRHGSLEGVLAAAESDDPRTRPRATARRCWRTPSCCARSRRSPRCVRIPVERPADRASDFAAGAGAARELGMARLAERLEGWRAPTADGGSGGREDLFCGDPAFEACRDSESSSSTRIRTPSCSVFQLAGG